MRIFLAVLAVQCFTANAFSQTNSKTKKLNKMKNNIEHINPGRLSKNPTFSKIVAIQGNGKTIYIGGQDALNLDGGIIGKRDMAAQTEKVMKNL
jgi:enamine deaminase RidA (YjgF/YER057c/UK114 family)